jgi:very-short-patch-repair endonuclease
MGMVTNEIMRIAEQRRNLITRSSLRSLGLSKDQIKTLTTNGTLEQAQPDVFKVGAGSLDFPQRALAACLADRRLVLSHGTAAQLWGLRRAPRDQIEATIVGTGRVGLAGVLVHRTNLLDPADITHFVDGTRLTSPGRVLFDLAGVLDLPALLSLAEDAIRRGLVSDRTLLVLQEQLAGRGRRGTALFRELVTGRPEDLPPVDSELELRFDRALRRVGLEPERQVRLVLPTGAPVRLDFGFRPERVGVEIDHRRWHTDEAAVQRDKGRDVLLAQLGFLILRYTEADIQQRLDASVAATEAVLRVRHRQLRAG